MNIKQSLQQAKLQLADAAEANLLLAYVLQCDKTYLIAHDEKILTKKQQHTWQQVLQRRINGEPIAYITGIKEFWSLPLEVNTNVLIPRADTECLVETVLQVLGQQEKSIIDLGTGSGAIALALAHERPQWQIAASDVSAAALQVAKHNAKQLNLSQINL